jgi:RHS repeat-associated protein
MTETISQGIALFVWTLPDAHQFVYFAPEVENVGGKLWKIVGPDGTTAYAGHESSASNAIAAGFDGTGRLVNAVDGGGRRFTYSYTNDRLTQIDVTIADAPTVVVASVTYAYYGASEPHGAAGELKTVTVRERTSEGSDHAWISRITGYRYAAGHVSMEVRPEGFRRMLAAGLSFDTASDASLAPYAWWRLSHQSDGRIATATGGGATSRQLAMQYAASPGIQTSVYDAGSRWSTTVTISSSGTGGGSSLRSDEYVFDEFGQSLGVISREPGTARVWARLIVRDSFGRVSSVHEPSNVQDPVSGANRPDVGIVTRIERIATGELAGFPRSIVRTLGAAPLAQQRADLHLTYWQEEQTSGRITLGDAQLVRVLVSKLTRFKSFTTTPSSLTGQAELYAYTFHDGLPLGAVRLRTVDYTPPKVDMATENGLNPNVKTTVETFNSASGDDTLTRTASGRLHYTRFDSVSGRESTYIHDAKSDSPLVASIIAASGYSSSAAPQAALHRVTSSTYDSLGRELAVTSYRGLTAGTWYGALADGRAVVITNPHRSGLEFFGPATVAVLGADGAPEAWGQVSPSFQSTGALLGRIASSMTPPQQWIDANAQSPVQVLAAGVPVLTKVRGIHLVERSEDGARTLELRRYHNVSTAAITPSGFGSPGANYDRWTFAWDAFGRNVASTTPAGTTRRKSLDLFGRTIAQIVEANRDGLMQSHTVRSFEYDGGFSGGDGRLTAIVEHPEPGVSHVTRLGYDTWGDLRAVRRPEPPHWLVRSNNWGQVEAVAGVEQLSEWSPGASVSVPEPDAAVVPARRALITKKYDSRGRLFERATWRVDQVTGAIPNCVNCLASDLPAAIMGYVYGPEGSIRATSGEQNTINVYNRACELLTSVELPSLNLDQVRSATVDPYAFSITGASQRHVDPSTGYVDASSQVIAGCGNEQVGMLPKFLPTEGGGFMLGADNSGGNILGGHTRTYRDLLGRPISSIDFGMPRPNRTIPIEYTSFQRESLPTYRPVRRASAYADNTEPASDQYRQSLMVLDEFGDVAQTVNPAGDVTFIERDDAGRVIGVGESEFYQFGPEGKIEARSCKPDKWQDITYEEDRIEEIKESCFGDNCVDAPPGQKIDILYPDNPPLWSPKPPNPFDGQPWTPGAIDNETPIGMLLDFEEEPDDGRVRLPDPEPIFGYPPEKYTQRVNALGQRTGWTNQANTLHVTQRDGVGRPISEFVVHGSQTSVREESRLRETPMVWHHVYDGMGRRAATSYMVPNATGDDWVNLDEWTGEYNSAGLLTSTSHTHRNFGGNKIVNAQHSWSWRLPNAGTHNYRLEASQSSGGLVRQFNYGSAQSRSFNAGRPISMTIADGDDPGFLLPKFRVNTCGTGGVSGIGTNRIELFNGSGGPPNLHVTQRLFDVGMMFDEDMLPSDAGGLNPFNEPDSDWTDVCVGMSCDPDAPMEEIEKTWNDRDGDGSPLRYQDFREYIPQDDGYPGDLSTDTSPVCAEGANRGIRPTTITEAPNLGNAPPPLMAGAYFRHYERWRTNERDNITAYRRGPQKPANCSTPFDATCALGAGDSVQLRVHDDLNRIYTQSTQTRLPGGVINQSVHKLRYDVAGNTIDTGGPYLYEYDLMGRLSGAYRRAPGDPETGDIRGDLFARFTYDSFGRLRSASYDIESPDGDLENENVDWYAYDEQWRLIAVYRQDFKYQAFKLRERIVYADAGVGAREGGGPGMKLDCPAYAEIDEDFDGEFDRRLVYVQNRGGHVVAVYDDHLTRLDSPTDTTPSRWPARIAYTAFGEPINIGVAGLGIYAENGNIYSRLDLDFNNDTHEDASDLAALGQVIGGAVCDTATQRCDNPDFNRDGEVNADDFTAFGQAMAGTYRVFATDITDYRFLYRGYWYDKHLGIYHVRHRAYDPAIQRWLQPDPAMFIDGMNVYAYCGNEPFAMYDPMGLWGENWGTSVANGGGGVGLGTAVEWAVGLGNAYTDNLAASITDPSGVTRAAEGVVHAVIAGVNAEKNNAAHGAYSSNAVDYAVSIAGQLTGTNKIAAGATGYLAAEDRLVSGVERAGLFFEGLSEAILTVAGGGKGGGNRAGIPQGTKALERIEPAAPVVELHRPYLRKATRQEIERRAVKDADGRYLDPNTGLPIQGKPDIGHIWGFEHRRLVKIAQQKGMTQKQFNDWVNSHPEWFQFECPRSNRSHKYEKPGND